MYKNAKVIATNDSWIQYKVQKNRVNTLLNRKKYNYYHKKFGDCKNNSAFWKPVLNMIGKNKADISNTPDVESLCDYFANSPLQISQSISKSGEDFRQFLGPRIPYTLNLELVSPDTVKTIINDLPSKKQLGLTKLAQKCLS